MKLSPLSVPALALLNLVSTDVRQQVVCQALTYWQTATPGVQRGTAAIFKQTLLVPGFRRGHIPQIKPQSQLERAVITALAYKELSVARAIIKLWRLSQPALEAAWQLFDETSDLTIEDHFELEKDQPVRWSPGFQAAVTAFSAQHSQYQTDEAALMLSCYFDLTESENDAAEKDTSEPGTPPENDINPLTGTLWQEWLETLAQLPANAAEWQQVEEFVQCLRQLAADKSQETTHNHEPLQQALDALRHEMADAIAFLGLGNCLQWQAAHAEYKEVEALAGEVSRWREALAEYLQLRRQPPQTLAAEEIWQHSLQRLRTDILGVYGTLDATLTPPAQEPNSIPEADDTKAANPPTTPAPGATVLPVAEPHTTTPANQVPTPVTQPASCPAIEQEPTPAQVETTPPQEPTVASEAWEECFWAWLTQEDVPAAYWLARDLEASGHSSPAPSWMVAAWYASQRLTPTSYHLAQDLGEIARQTPPDTHGPLRLLALAVSLRPALAVPSLGLQEWLAPLNYQPALSKLITAIKEFAVFGKPWQRGSDGHNTRQTQSALAAAATRWLAEAPRRRAKNKGATDVWRHLTNEGGALWQLLTPVSRQDAHAAGQARQLLAVWEDAALVSRRIDELHQATVHGRKAQPIAGPPRQQILHDVAEACHLARHWLATLAAAQQADTSGDWLAVQIERLRAAVQDTLPAAQAEVAALGQTAPDLATKSAVACLQDTLARLGHLFDATAETHADTTEAPMAQALAQRLLYVPQMSLDDEGQPLLTEPLQLARSLRQNAPGTPQAALKLWWEKEDYRFTDRLLSQMDTDAAEAWHSQYETSLAQARAALHTQANDTLEAVEQGVVDGIISDAQHAEYSDRIVTVENSASLNFHALRQQLKAVQDDLDQARQARLADLQHKWKGLTDSARQRLSAERYTQLAAFIQQAWQRGDTRVVDECLARLEETLAGSGDLAADWLMPTGQREPLTEFLAAAADISHWLQRNGNDLTRLTDALAQDKTIGQWTVGALLPTRLREVSEALSAWQGLKGRPAHKQLQKHIATLCNYLGLAFNGAANQSVTIERHGIDWLHAQIRGSASDLSRPIPQFGSQARQSYDLLCLWRNPSAETLGARLREAQLAERPTLIFYFGVLSSAERLALARLARVREWSAAILDDLLLAFLAGEKEARWRAFLPCALPFSAVNPYTPFQAGDVPPEMFFGREPMARELSRPQGSCLVYGGRQLGKSALLRQVQRAFHLPKQERYAWVEDINSLGDSRAGQPTDALWRRIRDNLASQNLMRRTGDKTEDIIRHLRGAMLSAPRRLVLLMCDEADHFLEADARDNFPVVKQLRSLMLHTEHRFKVVFAGLQNVQRFQGLPNQPLAHFGTPLPVGPLEPTAAQALVCEPLACLGYRFREPASVLRLLSYTNYHAGLIQIFCQELLKRLYGRTPEDLPPYFIEREDVESVYRDRRVRDYIRERFDWTLALSPRYQALAWAMIVDQISERDSYARTYPASELRALAASWWEAGFHTVGPDEMRGLLNEMCSLGVLVRHEQGRYRLRSPNLVRLMGTEEDISSRLLELADKPPEDKYDADSHHAQLDETARRYSPLTYAQERGLNLPQFGVGLVFGSPALGSDTLPEALRRFLPPDLTEETRAMFALIPPEVVTGAQISEWLHSFLAQHSKYERLIVCQRAAGDAHSLAGRVREALRFCRPRRGTQKQWLRVVFLFDPAATWQWLTLPAASRERWEEQADAATFPHCWNMTGIRQRLAHSGKIYSDEICQAVLKFTGGWPLLLEALDERCAHDDPRPCAGSLAEELRLGQTTLAQAWRNAFAVSHEPALWRVLQVIHEWQDEAPREIFAELCAEDLQLRDLNTTAALAYWERMGGLRLTEGVLATEPLLRQTLLAVN